MKRSAFTALSVIAALCFLIGCAANSGPVTVVIKETPAGRITLGTGWDTWDHWWGREDKRFRLSWNDEQWISYLGLLKESGADWVRLDFYYGNTEPRNDNDDPEVINWNAFTFDSPRLKSLYKHLDFFQANGIEANLTYTYLRSNQEYNLDRQTGWLSKEAVSKGFPELWTRPRDEPVDKRELAENMAATAYYLIKKRGYTSLKQLTLYVEPDNGRPNRGQWINVDGYKDTVFLAKLLTKLGIRDQVKILNGDPDVNVPKAWPPQLGDYDVFGVEDYETEVDWHAPERGLANLHPEYKILSNAMKNGRAPRELAVTEYGSLWCFGATDPSCAYLKNLSSSCLIFELYNSGFAGSLRWAFEPIFHPYLGFGVIRVEGVAYPPAAPGPPNDLDDGTTAAIIKAMEQGAKFTKVPYTFEPQRLVNTNLRRGSTVYEVEVADPTPPGKGVYAIAAKDAAGKWRVGLINLYAKPVAVHVSFPAGASPSKLRWDYYDATFPDNALQAPAPALANDSLSLILTARSLNFLSE